MRPLSRRAFLQAAGAALGAAKVGANPVVAAACPALTGPIRWIVPNAPGGGYDELSRLFEPHLEKALGARIQIDNAPGAGGLRGAGLISQAPPDGQTIGILNMPGLLMTRFDDPAALDPVEAFTLLGTIACSRHIWSTRADGEIRSADDLLRIGRGRGLVFAVSSFNSQGFFNAAVPCALLGLKAQFVAGYGSSGESILAAIRGEVDVVSLDSGTQIDTVGAGDLRPLLYIGGKVRAAWPEYLDLPTLGGPDGLARQEGPEATAGAEALVRFAEAGRVIAGPPQMPLEIEWCLGRAVCSTLADAEFERRAAAKRWLLEPACADQTLTALRGAREAVRQLAPIVEAARSKARA